MRLRLSVLNLQQNRFLISVSNPFRLRLNGWLFAVIIIMLSYLFCLMPATCIHNSMKRHNPHYRIDTMTTILKDAPHPRPSYMVWRTDKWNPTCLIQWYCKILYPECHLVFILEHFAPYFFYYPPTDQEGRDQSGEGTVWIFMTVNLSSWTIYHPIKLETEIELQDFWICCGRISFLSGA